jgi:hypothetical protein
MSSRHSRCRGNFILQSRGSSVGIVTSYGLDDRGSGVQYLVGAGSFSLLHRIHTGSGPTHPPIQCVPAVKRPGRQADRSHPSSAEVTNVWCYTSNAQYVFMAWCLEAQGQINLHFDTVFWRIQAEKRLKQNPQILKICTISFFEKKNSMIWFSGKVGFILDVC